MNILMIHPHDIYSPVEPWTVRITYLANEFTKMGHEVRVVYHLENPHAEPDIEKRRQEFPFKTIPMIRHAGTLLMKTKRMIELASWADVIHFQKCFAYVSIPSIIAGAITGTPVHYDWDDWEAEIFKNSSPEDDYWYHYIDRIERAVPYLVDTVSVASKSLWEKALKMGKSHTHVFEAPVGGDPQRFETENLDTKIIENQYDLRNPVITYLGQLHGAQYCSLFLQMAKILKTEGLLATFFVVGNGSNFLNLMREAEELGLQDDVIFTGSVPHDKVPYFLKASDVCVAAFDDTPQVRTKSPLKICEYMAAGRAIVASEVGEVSEMLDHGKAGLLVRPGDPRALASGVLRILRDGDLKEELQHNARQRSLERFNWTVTAENLIKLIT